MRIENPTKQLLLVPIQGISTLAPTEALLLEYYWDIKDDWVLTPGQTSDADIMIIMLHSLDFPWVLHSSFEKLMLTMICTTTMIEIRWKCIWSYFSCPSSECRKTKKVWLSWKHHHVSLKGYSDNPVDWRQAWGQVAADLEANWDNPVDWKQARGQNRS